MKRGCVFSVFQDVNEGTERAKLLAYRLNSVLLDFCGFIRLCPQEKSYQSQYYSQYVIHNRQNFQADLSSL